MPLTIEGNNQNDITLKALLMLLEVTMKIVQMLVGGMIKKGGGGAPNGDTDGSGTLKKEFNPLGKKK